jgi:hypothetical protein
MSESKRLCVVELTYKVYVTTADITDRVEDRLDMMRRRSS